MRKTSVYLILIVLYWFIMMQVILQAQTMPQIEHSQSMHQYILREAYSLLQRESPGMAARIVQRIGETDPGTHPWERKSIMSGVYREDAEDIVYGHGGPNNALQPGFDISRPGTCMEAIYEELTSQFKSDEQTTAGFVSVTHFWDEDAPDNVIRKDGIIMNADYPLNCLNTTYQRVQIHPAANAWEKIQRLLRPHWELAVRDRWWTPNEVMKDTHGNVILTLPEKINAIDEVRLRYNTLVELYNTGACTVEIPGNTTAVPVILSKEQRNTYVWEILGRACHLLADMSVPAHTHKDMHMGNLSISEMKARIAIRITVEDDESYENWIGSTSNAWWKAEFIQGGLIPLSNAGDPLYHLMSSMRSIAASFASDDYDGTGPYIGSPRFISEIPNRHNLPCTITAAKRAMMISIRDHTLPYAIRATATLLDWFVSQLNMPEDYTVWTVGATGYHDYFERASRTQPFPSVGTMSGTSYHAQAGQELSLRSHFEPHPVTNSKFTDWSDENKRRTIQHQWDDYVLEKQGAVHCRYQTSEVYTTPNLLMVDDHQTLLTSTFPLFKNPWHVDPSLSTAWNLEQPDRFDEYKPTPAPDANGGIFLSLYDVNKPPTDYYSIRASHVLDGSTRTHKTTGLEPSDYAFVEWEAIYARLFEDPKNTAYPPLPAYADREQYDTKIVDFTDQSAIVNAQYKKHRTSDRVLPPTNVNSQRKVAQDAREMFHAVYESGGRIWYVRSTDRGVTWSREERVSDNGGTATRPSVAAVRDAAWITYVADGEVVLRIRGNKGWETLYSAPVMMKDECTPAIAVLDDYEGAAGDGIAICLAWEDQFAIRFALINGTKVLIDNEVLAYGNGQPGNVDQPRFPSVAASTALPGPNAPDHGFHIAWLEDGSVFYVKLALDRRQQPLRVFGWQPGGAVAVETVHAKYGTLGVGYPARHAPSIAVTQEGTVHVAYDVQNWYSIWPNSTAVTGTPTGNPLQGMFAIRERALPTISGPTWQTTATLVGGSSNGAGLCSPSVGAKPASSTKGSKSNALRIPYNDAQGQLRVARLDGALSIAHHAEGWDPSLTVWSPLADGLVDVYSYTASQPYSWHMLASQNNLAKTSAGELLRMRQILLSRENAFVSVGFSHPRVNTADGIRDIEWNESHDSLVIGVNTSLAEKMRTDVFTPQAGEKLLVDIERFAMHNSETQAEILLRFNDAKSGDALRVISMPLSAFASASAMAVQEFDLSSIAGTAVFMSADMHNAGEQWSAAVVDRYAIADVSADGVMEKELSSATVQRPVLKQNHPNPFNPATAISYSVPEAGRVRLAVYNLLGEQVALLHDGWQSAGIYETRFDGTQLASGIYIYRLEAGGVTQTRSMHLVK
ncbi:MAG: T9SS type A sorting domain-containing protein [Bacteroidetes bacterium]|nr:T9SS type A sorting domain-containing protein [Bacteroidota bacterium]